MKKNLDESTVRSFGDEWVRFDQAVLTDKEAEKIFKEYFALFPWEKLTNSAIGFDMGSGSGRWAKLIAPRVGHLHCIDPSLALEVSKITLASANNVTYHNASVDESVLPTNSQDFGYSLGVLHHVPDTAMAIKACTEMLKPGAPLLVYLYYAFDNRTELFKLVWKCSDILRKIICRLHPKLKHFVTDILAAIAYYPLARFALIAERFGYCIESFPLSYYRFHSFYTMRTDSRDRFGTPLERRFTKVQIEQMMQEAGLEEIKFSDTAPYWCAIGYKSKGNNAK